LKWARVISRPLPRPRNGSAKSKKTGTRRKLGIPAGPPPKSASPSRIGIARSFRQQGLPRACRHQGGRHTPATRTDRAVHSWTAATASSFIPAPLPSAERAGIDPRATANVASDGAEPIGRESLHSSPFTRRSSTSPGRGESLPTESALSSSESFGTCKTPCRLRQPFLASYLRILAAWLPSNPCDVE